MASSYVAPAFQPADSPLKSGGLESPPHKSSPFPVNWMVKWLFLAVHTNSRSVVEPLDFQAGELAYNFGNYTALILKKSRQDFI